MTLEEAWSEYWKTKNDDSLCYEAQKHAFTWAWNKQQEDIDYQQDVILGLRSDLYFFMDREP